MKDRRKTINRRLLNKARKLSGQQTHSIPKRVSKRPQKPFQQELVTLGLDEIPDDTTALNHAYKAAIKKVHTDTNPNARHSQAVRVNLARDKLIKVLNNQ